MRRVEEPAAASGRPRARAAVGLLLNLALLAAEPAAARSVRLGRWTGFTEFGFDSQEQNELGAIGERPLFERSLAEQRLGLRNTATILSPRFLTVNFGLSLGLLQSRLTAGRDQRASGDGSLNGFDLNATFMPLKPYGFSLSSSRLENVIPVEFAGSRRLRSSQLGFSMKLGPRAFPSSLAYRDIELESTADLGRALRGLDQRTRTLTYRAENRWRRNELFAFLQLQEVEDRVAADFSNRSQTASLNHTVELLAPKLATLRGNLRYFDRRGQLAASSFHLDQELRLRHSDALSSGMRLEIRDLESFFGPASDSRQYGGWVHHRLWQSLETDVRLSRTSLTSDAGRSDHDQALLRLDYRKKLPAGGRLYGRLAATYERRDSLLGDGQEPVVREPHTVRFGVPARLDRPRVLPGSVVISDELGTTLFEEGVDYELRVAGEFTEVLPLPGGRLRDGQVVLVDYRVEVPAMSESTSRRESVDFTVDYGWVAPFFGYQRADEQLISGRPSSLFDDRRESYGGVRFRVDGPKLRLVSHNELRSRDSSLLAFESLRLADGLSYSPARHWTLTANLVYLETRFEVPARTVRIDDAKLGVRWRPLPSLSLESYGAVREVRDTLAADQVFDRLGFEVRWNLGKISLIGSVERWQRERDGQDLEGTRASLTVSRRFFPGMVTARRRRPPPEPWPDDLPGLAPTPYSEAPAWARPGPAAVAPEPDLFDLAGDEPGEGEHREGPDAAAENGAALAPAVPAAPNGSSEGTPAGLGAAPSPQAEPEPAAASGEEIAAAVHELIVAWSAAWSSLDVESYLGHYAEEFRPADGVTRGDWEAERRSRLGAAQWIEVRCDAFEIVSAGPGRATVTFVQTYRSDRYSDVVRKRLELTRQEDRWRIVTEIVIASR